uniref:Uncharacterized protein n=1 Tax=Anguilla anguilla TaxID=7936 RepID=A0A0E9TW11_ANGAN
MNTHLIQLWLAVWCSGYRI